LLLELYCQPILLIAVTFAVSEGIAGSALSMGIAAAGEMRAHTTEDKPGSLIDALRPAGRRASRCFNHRILWVAQVFQKEFISLPSAKGVSRCYHCAHHQERPYASLMNG
jgi:hypothetical protein